MMRYLKLFEGFNREDIDSICKMYGIKNYTINEDGSIDVDGDVDLSYELYNSGIKKIPLNFGKVTGNFTCKNNGLKSLEGSPREVGGNFDCQMNIFTSLEGAPQSVGGDFICYSWKLLSLEGIGYVGGEISIKYFSPCYLIYGSWIYSNRTDELLDMMEDYDFLRTNEIYWERLEAFYRDSGLEIPDREELEKYYTIID